MVARGPTLRESILKKGGLPFEEALQAGKLPSVKKIIEVVAAEGVGAIQSGIPCWTSTIAAYAPPGQPLGDVIRHLKGRIRWSLEVPAEYRDKKDVTLIVDQPDYTILCKDDEWTVQSARFKTHPFPDGSNWFRFDQGMPCGPALGEDSPEAIWLSRGESYVGPVTIGFASRVIYTEAEKTPSTEHADSTGLTKSARAPRLKESICYLSINLRSDSEGLGVIIENEAGGSETQTARAPG